MGAELLVTKVKHRTWMTMVQQQFESGLSVAEWCSKNQVSTKSFYYRRKQLRAEVLQSNNPMFAEIQPAASNPIPANNALPEECHIKRR